MRDAESVDNKRYFLGVSRSVSGQAWVDRLDRPGLNNALAISQKYGLPDLLARVLSGRGVDEGEAADFIDPTLRALMPDPASFTDMDKAASRIADAISRREVVAIFGDYDVDGACSAAILSRFLNAFGVPNRIYIPDRIVEGYGPNDDAMRMLVKEGAKLIVTVDCGAVSAGPIAAAAKAGADVVVLDHHQMGADIPQAAFALVNPNRPDDLSGQGFLCAAGVVFITLAAVSRVLRARGVNTTPDLLGLLDLVALATVCDVVPLVGVNRAFVVKGLQVARAMHNVGLTALARAARIGEPLSAFHLGYILGPRINAGGRIGNPALGAHLLTSLDTDEAAKIASELEVLNAERQAMEARQLEEAEAQLAFELSQGQEPSVIVVANAEWHAGIVGLLAARLKERFKRPAIVLAIKPDGTATGSARSILGFDIGALVRGALEQGIIEKGGGHGMAAGLTLNMQAIDAFRNWCEAQASSTVTMLNAAVELAVDGAVSARGASVSLFEMLEKAGPFGAGNDAPVFAVPAHRLVDVREVGRGHVSVTLANIEGKRLKAIAFRAIGTPLGDFLLNKRGEAIHAIGNLSLNYWNGSVTPQLRIIDAAPA